MPESSEYEDLLLRYTRMAAAYDEDPRCYLVALDAFDIGLIQSALRYAHWLARWRDLGELSFADINHRVNELEECLMSGCDVGVLIGVLEDGFSGLSASLESMTGALSVLQPGCTSGGTEAPAEDGQENGIPPSGYVPPDPGTENRKCKVANFIVDSVKKVVQTLQVLDAEQWVGVGFIMACSLLGALIGSAVPVAGTLIGAAAGVVVNIVVMLIVEGVAADLDDLITILDAYRDEFVCALYTSASASGARVAFQAVLSDKGGSWLEGKLCGLCLPNKLTNLLFFTIPIYEMVIAAYECITSCGECPGGEEELTITIIEDWGDLEWDGTLCIIHAEEETPTQYRANFQCNVLGDPEALRCALIDNWSSDETMGQYQDNQITTCDWQTYYLPKPFDQDDIQGFRILRLCGNNAFTVTFDFLGEYTP